MTAVAVEYCRDHGLISIHTPARGVTEPIAPEIHIDTISIHTPARGVTLIRRKVCVVICISIHTPARGVTRGV